MIGPILAVTFAVAVRDNNLLVLGMISEAKMCCAVFITGALLTLTIFGHVSRALHDLEFLTRIKSSEENALCITIWRLFFIVRQFSVLCVAKPRND